MVFVVGCKNDIDCGYCVRRKTQDFVFLLTRREENVQRPCLAISNAVTCTATCTAGYVGGNIFGFSSTACNRFAVLVKSRRSFPSISTRLNAGVGTLPTYVSSGGPTGRGHVNFNSINKQFLSTGSRSMNCFTNQGFTVIMLVKWNAIAINQRHYYTNWI